MEINKEEILKTYKWIKVSKYKEPDLLDDSIDWKIEYQKLLDHHVEETQFLIDKIRDIVSNIE